MKIIINIIRGILIGALSLIILINLWLLIDKYALGNDPPTIMGHSYFAVTTGSMEPTISAGDLIITKARSSYDVGEVVTYTEHNQAVVTHRIVGSISEGYITRGDANNIEDDELLSDDRIIGEVVFTAQGMGSIVLFLSSPFGMLITLVVAFIVIELPSLIGGRDKGAKGRHYEE